MDKPVIGRATDGAADTYEAVLFGASEEGGCGRVCTGALVRRAVRLDPHHVLATPVPPQAHHLPAFLEPLARPTANPHEYKTRLTGELRDGQLLEGVPGEAGGVVGRVNEDDIEFGGGHGVK